MFMLIIAAPYVGQPNSFFPCAAASWTLPHIYPQTVKKAYLRKLDASGQHKTLESGLNFAVEFANKYTSLGVFAC